MFRANSAHHQEVSCINTASGIINLKRVSSLKLLKHKLAN